MSVHTHTGRYTVVGKSEVHGHKPGETFTLTAPYEQIGQLILSGHIAVAAEDDEV